MRTKSRRCVVWATASRKTNCFFFLYWLIERLPEGFPIALWTPSAPHKFVGDYRNFKDTPHNCAKTSRVIFGDPNFEKKRNSSALFAREINLVTQPSFDCKQGINSQVQTVCSNADAVFPVLGIVSCRNERFSLSRKTHVPLWNAPRISHVRLP